jgi:hypothetical protein
MMKNAVAVARHLYGLFVDDGSIAVAILAWLALDGLLSRLAAVSAVWRGPVLLVGLVFLISWACLRSARRQI